MTDFNAKGPRESSRSDTESESDDNGDPRTWCDN